MSVFETILSKVLGGDHPGAKPIAPNAAPSSPSSPPPEALSSKPVPAAFSADQAFEDEIVSRVQKWAGSRQQALDWYRTFEIPSLGNKTAEALAKDGDLSAVKSYLDRVSDGGFA